MFFDYNMDVFTDGNVPPPSTADLDDEIVNRPLNAKYAAFTSVVSQTQFFHVKVNKTISLDKFLNDCCYLSLDGDDSNDGLTKDTPIQTINRAKEITAKTLYILSGEYENFDVNFSDFDNIIGIGNVVLMKYKQKITEATLVSGMTKVYQVPCSIKSTVGFLWQHNIADPVTLITDTEKHPYYQYKTHRLPSTRLYPAATVEEIEQETTKLMYYLDTTNDILYFSKTENSDLNNNPIIVTDSSVGYGASKNRNVEIKNINIKYCNFATKNLTGKITNVSVGMCTGSGAFKLDDTKDLFLYSCEGYACTTPSGGDGFNTHVSANYDYAKIIMFDCWGHDNSDDGESCHSNSCIIQHGGLYEYNGSGCTPASGGCGEYHNVVCRKNGDWDWTYADKTGFSAQGSVTVDGITIYSTIKCFNCVAQDNNIGFRDTNTNNSGSSCYNCISINNNTDFSSISHYGDTIV